MQVLTFTAICLVIAVLGVLSLKYTALGKA